MRAKSKNDFEKNFFKLMNNAFYGKTMLNKRKQIDVKLVNTYEKAQKLFNKSTFNSFKVFNENLLGIHTYEQR